MSLPTAAQVITKVRSLAEAQPNFVYFKPESDIGLGNGCLYVHGRGTDNERGGCIVGQALMALGVEIDVKHEANNASSVIRHMGIEHTPSEVTWLDTVQSGQDTGETWESAVCSADSED